MAKIFRPTRDKMSESGIYVTERLLTLLEEYEAAQKVLDECPRIEGGWDIGRGERARSALNKARNKLTDYMYRVGFAITKWEQMEAKHGN